MKNNNLRGRILLLISLLFFIYILHYTRSIIVVCFSSVKTIQGNLVNKSLCNFSFKDFSFGKDSSFTSLASGSAGNHLACSSESSEPFTILITKKHSTLSMVSI